MAEPIAASLALPAAVDVRVVGAGLGEDYHYMDATVATGFELADRLLEENK